MKYNKSFYNIFFSILFVVIPIAFTQNNSQQINHIADRLQLFTDKHLVDKMELVEFYLHEPCPVPLAQSPLPIKYTTVIKDGTLYRAYYRDVLPGYTGPVHDGHPGEITCYAESQDGREWVFPNLDITDVKSSKGNNVILVNAAPCSHNFSPFIDMKPDVNKAERYKALAGTHPGGGLYAFTSDDGIHWEKIREQPVITSTDFTFDSQNIAFWSVAENCYVCYFRSWKTPHGKLRTISRTTSDDFIHWSKPIATNPNLPAEHLYTSQTHPYFRAPHIYIALPTRFVPERGSSTDILFMSTRAGTTSYDRLFTRAFIRPGLDPDRWGNRSNYVALNVVPTSSVQMSIYHSSGHCYVLRTDGFVSVRAGVEKGQLITKPISFYGDELVVNVSTSAVGSMRVEIQEPDGTPIPEFQLDNCLPIIGDEIARKVEWKGGADLSRLAGKPIRLCFVMTECDLYSIKFNSNKR